MTESADHLDFSALTGEGVRVAVVDSGIDPLHPRISSVEGGVDLSLDGDGAVRRGVAITDRAGHGTACAGIIRKKAPAAELYSIRIFDETLSTDGRLLVAAIRWAVEEEMHVVNLSLGTTDASLRDELAAACWEAVSVGVVLVAAQHNEGLDSYPAILPSTIGVKAGQVHSAYGYHYSGNASIDCIARGDPQRVCWLNGTELMMGGSSFAAAHISAIAALIRQAVPGADLAQMRKLLRANATSVRAVTAFGGADSPARSEGEDACGYAWIHRAVLYPFTKEMHAFIRFRDLLPFELAGVADPVGRGLVGRDAGEALGTGRADLQIGSRLDQLPSDCDTLILGYLDALGAVQRRDLMREFLSQAIDRRLNVFAFQDIMGERYRDLRRAAAREGLTMDYPRVTAEEGRQILGSPPIAGIVDVPVLGVFGTSSSQGKFTLQLVLRRALKKLGYTLGQLGTEPHSRLFGMDCAFPMGYASTVDLPLEVYPEYLDRRMREVCWQRRPDLILVGCQSGSIPFDLNDPRTLSLPSLAFLVGVKPDACILVVNAMDPEAYVWDTISALRTIGKCVVIALAMSDRPKVMESRLGRSWATHRDASRDDLRATQEKFEDSFGLPVVGITAPEGTDRLVAVIIDYFADGGVADVEGDTCARRRASAAG